MSGIAANTVNSVMEEILRTAAEAGASDVHLTVGTSPRMRVNDKLITMDYPVVMSQDTMDVLLSIMSERQRERFEECGEYDMTFTLSDGSRCRVNVYKQRGLVAFAFRLINNEILEKVWTEVPEPLRELAQKQSGLVLVTGSTGSGKTTTLAAILDHINSTREAHIITLEKPVEYEHPHKLSMVNQREVGLDTESYASGLRAALRENPDVIMVGELCNYETIDMAVAAAEAGHLVLSTLNTLEAAEAVEHIVEMCPEGRHQQVRARIEKVLEAVVSQKLITESEGRGRKAVYEMV